VADVTNLQCCVLLLDSRHVPSMLPYLFVLLGREFFSSEVEVLNWMTAFGYLIVKLEVSKKSRQYSDWFMRWVGRTIYLIQVITANIFRVNLVQVAPLNEIIAFLRNS